MSKKAEQPILDDPPVSRALLVQLR
jgi:hypothetical protein